MLDRIGPVSLRVADLLREANPNHGEDGKFSSADATASAAKSPGSAGAHQQAQAAHGAASAVELKKMGLKSTPVPTYEAAAAYAHELSAKAIKTGSGVDHNEADYAHSRVAAVAPTSALRFAHQTIAAYHRKVSMGSSS